MVAAHVSSDAVATVEMGSAAPVGPPAMPGAEPAAVEVAATAVAADDSGPGFWGRHVENWLALEVSMVVHMLLFLGLAAFSLGHRSAPAIAVALIEPDNIPIDPVQPEAPVLDMPVVEQLQGSDALDVADPVGLELDAAAAAVSEPVEVLPTAELPTDLLAEGRDLAKQVGGAGDGLGGGGTGRGLPGNLGDYYDQRLTAVKAKTGDIQVSLFWTNYNDLDLHVICPSGEHIYFSRARSRCGGRLDIDMNVQPFHSKSPVENIFWPTGKAPPGKYVVAVEHYHSHGAKDPTEFLVRVKVNGQSQDFRGLISHGQQAVVVHKFERE